MNLDPQTSFSVYNLAPLSCRRDITLGYISVFNLLPDCVFVVAGAKLPISVKDFQSNLASFLRFVCSIHGEQAELFSARVPLSSHLLRKYRNLDAIPEV